MTNSDFSCIAHQDIENSVRRLEESDKSTKEKVDKFMARLNTVLVVLVVNILFEVWKRWVS